MALRYADLVKYHPQGVTDAFMADLKRHFTDAEICEMGYVVLAYGGAHNFLSSIGEVVLDEDGERMDRREGFPLVFFTHEGRTEYQSPDAARVSG